MRRSILIVMLDVMVLSVLALTSGLRSGGPSVNMTVPLYRWSSMIEEGLRKEQTFQDQVQLLEAQLAEATELAKKALEQAQRAQTDVGAERAGNQALHSQLRMAELAAEKARSQAALASREAELASAKSASLELRTREMERREAEARQRADLAITKARSAEADALSAERRALSAAAISEALKKEIEQVNTAQRTAEITAEESAQKLKQLEAKLAVRNNELMDARVAETAARERAAVAAEERERVAEKSESVSGELMDLREKMAVLEVKKQDVTEKVVQLESEQRQAEEERSQSVWVRRDAALRTVTIGYTEYNQNSERTFTTRRQLVMPIVKVGSAVLIPADFQKLGLNSSFWGGLSDYVTEVRGTLSSVSGQEDSSLSIRSIIVPGVEPQVCFVHFAGSTEGAINSISMSALKEQRLTTALLFSPDDANEHGMVTLVPVVGSDYLNVRGVNGKRPKVGDYLLSERGEFIGIMVSKDICYVTPQSLARDPAPIGIPFSVKKTDELYFTDFVSALKAARDRVKQHISTRTF